MTCTQVSGQSGAFQIADSAIASLQNWNLNYNAGVNSESRGNTKGYKVSWVGVKSASGGFSIPGITPIIKIKDMGLMKGFTGRQNDSSTGTGFIYKLYAAINSVVLNVDYTNQTMNTQYGFVNNYTSAGSELQIDQCDTSCSNDMAFDTSEPKVIRPPGSVIVDGLQTYPLLLNGSPLCAQNLTISFSCTPNTTSHSCSAGWQTLLGMSAVDVTMSATCICANMNSVPEIGTCNRLQVYSDFCDATKFWDFNYFLINGKDGLTVDVVNASGVTFTLNMTYSIAPCDCATTGTGYIAAPNPSGAGQIAWVGTLPSTQSASMQMNSIEPPGTQTDPVIPTQTAV